MSPLSLAVSSARHPRIVITAWAVAFVISIGIAGVFWGQGLTAERKLLVDSESNAADKLLEERFRGPRRYTEIVVVHSGTYTIVDPQFEATVQNLFFDISSLGPDVVAGVSQYYHSGSDYQVSDSGHSTIMPVTMAGTLDEAAANVSDVMSVVRSSNRQDDFTVVLVGEASVASRIAETANRLYLASQVGGFGNLAYYFTFILVCGIGVLAGTRLPAVLSLPMVVIPAAGAALIGLALPVYAVALNALVLIAAVVGMVFPILIAHRYRDERLLGHDKLSSIDRACSTAGLAIVFGGLSAMIGLVVLLIVPANIVMSAGLGAILAIAVPLLGATTLTPALIALRGDPKIESRLHESDDSAATDDPPSKGWGRLPRLLYWVAKLAMRRPVLSAVVATILLVVLSLPALNLKLGFNSVETMPNRHENRNAYGPQINQAFTQLAEDFPAGVMSPVEIVINAPFVDPDVEARVALLQAALTTDPEFSGQIVVQTNLDRDMVLISVPTRSHPESESAIESVRRLMDEHIPEVFDDAEIEVLVTGRSAFAADLMHIVVSYTPVVLAVALASSFLILLVATRSLVVPVLATLMNILSVGAACGIMAFAFQHDFGWIRRMPVIEAWAPMLFVPLLIGLFTVNHLLLLGRIRERYAQSGDSAESLASGLRATVGVVTVMSLVMAAVFGNIVVEAFEWRLVVFHQIGIALAAGLLIDAVLVRLVLLPSALKLLGPATWYLPPILKWLPDIGADRESL